MEKGDYKERKRIAKSGKQVTDKIVVSTSGTEYVIGPKMGQGGVARVFRARRVTDGKEFAFKEYVPTPERMKIHREIKKNLQTLIKNPVLDQNGTPLKSLIHPKEIVEFPVSHGFGYIMELVDTDNYVSLKSLWHPETYPDALLLCKICKNIAHLFTQLHLGTGWCYKDINEGNIYINPKTGDVFVIDLDNISVPETKTILGTPGYMAPEVYITNTPNIRTDQFSMAVYFYRLLVGGFPMEGKKTIDYLKKKNTTVHDAGREIYGKMALFAFDPIDKSNEIRSLKKEKDGKKYSNQVELWDNLPQEIQNCFIKTFSTGLKKRELRTTDGIWYKTFDTIEKQGLVKCKCGKHNFGSSTEQKKCMFCGSRLPMLKPVNPFVKKQPKPSVATELTTAVFRARRDVTPSILRIEAKRKAELTGSSIHPELPDTNLMRIEYNRAKNLLSAVNTSNMTWSISNNGKKESCPPGKRVILSTNLVITVMYRKLELRVLEIR